MIYSSLIGGMYGPDTQTIHCRAIRVMLQGYYPGTIEKRMVNGYRKISFFNREIEVPNVPLGEQVEFHLITVIQRDVFRGANMVGKPNDALCCLSIE